MKKAGILNAFLDVIRNDQSLSINRYNVLNFIMDALSKYKACGDKIHMKSKTVSKFGFSTHLEDKPKSLL